MTDTDSQPALQRPSRYRDGLKSQPWWRSDEISFATILEIAYQPIRQELINLLVCGRLSLHPQSKGGPKKNLSSGNWNMFELVSSGRINVSNAVEAPCTVRLLADCSDVMINPNGLAYFSVLSPNSQISPHCGTTNTRIRIHLGLIVPSKAAIRVGTEFKSWTEGKCLVFDDSWEHEVYNASDRFRSVLLVDVWHPEIPMREREEAFCVPRRSPSSRQREGWKESYTELNDRVFLQPLQDLFMALDCATINSLSSRAFQIAESDNECLRGAGQFFKAHTLAESASAWQVSIGTGQIWDAIRNQVLVEELNEQEDALRECIWLVSIFWRSSIQNIRTQATFESGWLRSDRYRLFRELSDADSGVGAFIDTASGLTAAMPFGAVAALIVAVASVVQQDESRPRSIEKC